MTCRSSKPRDRRRWRTKSRRRARGVLRLVAPAKLRPRSRGAEARSHSGIPRRTARSECCRACDAARCRGRPSGFPILLPSVRRVPPKPGATRTHRPTQAPASADAFESHQALAGRAEQMVAVWENLKGARDIVRHRKLGSIRFALFGGESLNDFAPLRRVIEAAVSPERLAEGRPLRVGVTSFASGAYREVWMNGKSSNVTRGRFMDYLFASSMLPVIGRMPRIAAEDAE